MMKRLGGKSLEISIVRKHIGAEKWRKEWSLAKQVEDREGSKTAAHHPAEPEGLRPCRCREGWRKQETQPPLK